MTAAVTAGPLAPAGAARLLGAPAVDWPAHLTRYGPPPIGAFAGRNGAARLIELVARAGLRGRGGAGFPTADKLAAVASAGRRPVVVVNACESEPASRKDAALLATAPHLVLDGAALAAHALRASHVVVCVHRGDPLAGRLWQQIAQRGGDRTRWRLAEIPRRYVASEASALVNFLTTGDSLPTSRPPRSAERGVRGRPTLVSNAETLAHLAQIARFGADWYRRAGTPAEPGTCLVTVSGAVRRPGVYEIGNGTPLVSALEVAGGPDASVSAVLVGGFGGTWVPLPSAATLSHRHGPARVALGAGVLVALPESACGLTETARVLGYLAHESAGQCGPCVFGLPAVATDFALLAAGRADPGLYQRLTARLSVIPGRGACGHPDGAVALAASALRTFDRDVHAHLSGRPCAGHHRPPILPVPRQWGADHR